MKYPALIVGAIMFTVFIMDPKTKKWWNEDVKGRYIPSTCKALQDRLEPKVPSNWEIECPSTSKLVLKVDFDQDFPNAQSLKTGIYRDMANSLKSFSIMANPETLENLDKMEILMVHDKMEVWGITDGQAMVKLRDKKSQKDMAEHLELTVKVKEKIK